MKKIAVELIKGRHEFKNIDGYLFNRKVRDVRNFYNMDMSIMKAIDVLMKKYNVKEYRELELQVYVTGLTVALVEVINFCSFYGIKLVLFHYDKISKGYYKQQVYLK